MTTKASAAASDPNDEIAAWALKLQEAQQRLQELTGGGVDSVLYAGGQSYLLQEAQEKLRQSETSQRQLAATMTAILNALPAHIALLDAQGTIISVNEAWVRFGVVNALQGPDFFVDQNYVEICERASGSCAEEAHAAARGIRRVLEGESEYFELEYPCHSPTKKSWFQLVATPVRSDELRGAVVMHVDITSRKLAEENLLANTALLEAQLNSTLDGVIVIDAKGTNVLHNRRVLDLWKFPQEIIDAPENKKRLEWMARQMKEPQAFLEKVAWLYAHPTETGLDEIELVDGRCVELYSAPVLDKKGNYYGRIWVTRDITGRKSNERRDIEQLGLLRMAGRVGKLGAWAAEYPGPKIIWSEEVYRIHEVEPGFKPDHESTLSFFLPDSRAKLEAAIRSQQPYDLELEIITAKGNKRWVRTTSSLEWKDGKVQRLYGVFQDRTDRQQAEKRLRRLFDSNAQCVFFWNKRGEILDANDAFLELMGYTREDLNAGRIGWTAMTPPQYVERDRRAMEEVSAEGFCKTYEKEFIRKDGSRVPILVGAATFEDNPDEGICFVIDLTERRRMESRFRRLVDSNAQGVMFWDKAGPIIDGNNAFLRLVGYTREDLRAKRLNWQTLTVPEDLATAQRALEEIPSNGSCAPFETEWIRKDGERVPVYLSAGSFEDDPNQGVTFALDLSERKKTEARFRRLIDSNVQNVMFWNKNGKAIDANDGFLHLIGYTREDLQAGRIKWTELTPPEYAEVDRRRLEEIAAKGFCAPYEKEYIRKDGSRVPVLIGSASFEDNPDEGVVFVLDLTERKKLEQQFLRAQRMESIGTLAGGIAHDLNNILAPIMMSIDVLKMTVTDPQASSILQTIETSSKRGADIVRQVLSFARGMEGERVEVQAKHLLKDIDALIRDTFPKNIRRELAIPADLWTILGDPTLIHQILLNLCVNARDAMPYGGKLSLAVENCVLDEQYVSMNPQAKAGRYVLISVTDTGTGMAPEIQEKIFEPFFTTKEVGKGTGLGLSTVMGIVKSHEGIITVYSEPGKGTTFRVYLPAMEHASGGQTKQTQSVSLPRGNGEMILIVDDEASVLTITSQTLEAFGYRAITATDGAEAVAIYAQRQNEIAVVITDMMMPVMDGPATMRALMRIDPAVKIIAASGLSANGSTTKISEVAIKHFLTKPYTSASLLKTLRMILDEG